jgi:hypothetical protein
VYPLDKYVDHTPEGPFSPATRERVLGIDILCAYIGDGWNLLDYLAKLTYMDD